MASLINTCPSDTKTTILDKFNMLERLCLPHESVALPTFKFKSKKDFSPTDILPYGASLAFLTPDEIKERAYLDRQTLRDSYLDFISSGKQKWFYNTWEITGNFFSEDGEKKVEVAFEPWMDAEKLWSLPGIKKAMRSVLTLCEGSAFPSQDEAQRFFDDALCRKIYQRQPSNRAIKQAVLELIEPLRKALASELINTYANAIIQSQRFKKYAQEHTVNFSKPAPNLVTAYLKINKNAIYLFGEKFGLIKKASRAIHYQNLRDAVRHPDEVHVLMSSPQKIYNDFCDILMLPAKSSSNAHSEQDIIENLETEINLENMSELLKVISAEEDPNLKKSNPAYWQDLINKGILDQKQATYLSQIILACNDVAHGNPNAATNKPVVINDGQLMGLKLDVSKHHDKKEAEKKQQIRKWIEENSHSL